MVGFIALYWAGLKFGSASKNATTAQILSSSWLGPQAGIAVNFILVPLSILAVATGLFRYYRVAVKLVLAFGATLLLLLHQFTEVAAAAKRVSQSPSESLPQVGALGFHLARDAGLGLLVLLVITALSIFKPWGRLTYSTRRPAAVAVAVGCLASSSAFICRACWALAAF
ncbi:MAG TPA: hypothetical protein VHD32_00985 [Candidatus Didemnitutus sp.]|nr:hypothetical protein [Candidatus Didemnitutus sp.]